MSGSAPLPTWPQECLPPTVNLRGFSKLFLESAGGSKRERGQVCLVTSTRLRQVSCLVHEDPPSQSGRCGTRSRLLGLYFCLEESTEAPKLVGTLTSPRVFLEFPKPGHTPGPSSHSIWGWESCGLGARPWAEGAGGQWPHSARGPRACSVGVSRASPQLGARPADAEP